MNSITKSTRGNSLMNYVSPFDSFLSLADGFFDREFSSDYIYNEYLSRSSVKTTDTGYTVQVTVPGCGPEDVDVYVEEDTLRIKSEKQRFEKKYKLPKDVDKEAISASVKHGLLDVTLPKSTKKDSSSIKIKVK